VYTTILVFGGYVRNKEGNCVAEVSYRLYDGKIDMDEQLGRRTVFIRKPRREEIRKRKD
jgi:hypothetical protein